MIPVRILPDWRARAPWPTEDQVEQDLILTRMLIAIFSEPQAADSLAFRGGTALHKLVFTEPGRYSEDIDLVQRRAGPIKPILEVLQPLLDPWLGKASIALRRDAVRLSWRYEAEASGVHRRIKLEINTREHESFDPIKRVPVGCDTRWFVGAADVMTFTATELLATKMRALYQRKKGRDLFDLGHALATVDLDGAAVVERFRWYLTRQGLSVSRPEFETNLSRKLDDRGFTEDVAPLLRAGLDYDARRAGAAVVERLLVHL